MSKSKLLKPYLKVVILDFTTHSVVIENLPDTETEDTAEDYISNVLNYNLSNCQWMVDPNHIGIKSPKGDK